MKTIKLIDIPPADPSKRCRLSAFKKQHGILTHCAAHLPKEDMRWLALIPFADDVGKDVGEIMAESCELYEESGRCALGTGELSAVRKLCQQLHIPFSV